MKIIEVIVSPTGNAKVETKGFAGPECQQASRFIESALGQRISERPTTELHECSSGEQLNRQIS
jgi:hypothetical protein